MFDRLIDWLIDWLSVWLIDWLLECSIDWLIDCLLIAYCFILQSSWFVIVFFARFTGLDDPWHGYGGRRHRSVVLHDLWTIFNHPHDLPDHLVPHVHTQCQVSRFLLHFPPKKGANFASSCPQTNALCFDVHSWPNRDWVMREAYLELHRREKFGLPLVDPDLIARENIALPSEEDLEDFEVTI